jgi:hypothetical protein
MDLRIKLEITEEIENYFNHVAAQFDKHQTSLKSNEFAFISKFLTGMAEWTNEKPYVTPGQLQMLEKLAYQMHQLEMRNKPQSKPKSKFTLKPTQSPWNE